LINAENFIYSQISTVLREKYGQSIYLSGEYIDSPAKFPAVTIVEESNTVSDRETTFWNIENAVDVMYAVNVYDNTVGYKKSKVKEIVETVNDAFDELGFGRRECNPISNLQDATIYRMAVRYSATIWQVGEDFFIYPN
jgi:hypothetical protein